MKRLKLQKALLAICLALPTTSIMSNEITAMEANNSTINQNSNADGSKEQTNLDDTFAAFQAQYFKSHEFKNKLTNEQLIKILRQYIQQDIIKYLALRLLGSYRLNKIPTTEQGQDLITGRQMQTVLVTQSQQVLKRQLESPREYKRDQCERILDEIKDIRANKKEKPTTEEKILKLLFAAYINNKKQEEGLQQLPQLIEAYTKEEPTKEAATKEGQQYSLLLSFLGQVAEKLFKENSYLNSGKTDNKLYQLAKIVSDFNVAYKKRQEQLKQLQQQIEKDNYRTYTQALKYFVEQNGVFHLQALFHQLNLKCYIDDNPVKYLALLIQASYDLIEFPTNITKDESVNSHNINKMLLTNTPNKLRSRNLMQTSATTATIGDILDDLATIEIEKPEEITAAAKILKLLFINTLASKASDNEARINSLKKLIKQYKAPDNKEAGHSYGNILRLLDGIATQLQKEANDLHNEAQKKQLTELSQLVSDFSEAYKQKIKTLPPQQPQQQNNPQSFASTSNPPQDPQLNENNTQNNNLVAPEYHKLLTEYINETTGKCLGLLIQATNNSIHSPEEKNILHSVLSQTIYTMLLNNYPDKLATSTFREIKDTVEEDATIIAALVIVVLYKPEDLKNAKKDLKLLFTLASQRHNNKDRINRLKDLIDKYKKQKQTKKAAPTEDILSILGEIGTQLQNVAKGIDYSPGNKKPNELSTNLQSFFRAYKVQHTLTKLVIKRLKRKKQKRFYQIKRIARKSTYTLALNYVIQHNQLTYLTTGINQKILKNYINDIPTKYLALLIQAKNDLVQFPKEIIYLDQSLKSDDIYDMLLKNYPYKLDPTNFMNTYEKTQEITDILAGLETLQNADPDELTDAQKILAQIFTQESQENNNNKASDLLTHLINKYKTPGQEQPPERYPYNHLISLLGGIATQLQDEAKDLEGQEEQKQLQDTAQEIQSFYEAYVQKHEQQQKEAPQQPPQQTKVPKSKLATRTLTEALNNNLEYHENENHEKEPILRPRRYQQILKKHINNDPDKYLALLIQASYKLIQFPTGVFKYYEITPQNTYGQLAPDWTYEKYAPPKIEFMDNDATTDEFKAILKLIQHLNHKENAKHTNYLENKTAKVFTDAEQIIIQLFLNPFNSSMLDTQDRINKLKDLLKEYTNKTHTAEGPVTVSILSSLGKIATQLEEEAAAFNNDTLEKKQLQQLAEQIRLFYNANKVKQAENKKQENNKQSQLNKSTLPSKSTKTLEEQDKVNNVVIIDNKNRAVQKADTLEQEAREDEQTNKTNNTKETQITTKQEELDELNPLTNFEDEFPNHKVDNKKTEINNLEITDTSLPKHHSEVNQDNKKGTNTKATLNHSSNAYHSQNDDDVSAKEPNEEEKSEHSLPTSNVNEQASNPNADNLGTHKIQLVEDTKETHEEENKENVQNDIETSNLNFNLTKNSDGPDVENDKNNTNQGGQKANKEEQAAKKMLRKEKEERINNNQALQIKDLKNNQSKQEQDKSKAPLQEYIGKLTKQVNQLTEQNKDIDDKHKTYLILRIQQTLSKLHIERIKKLTTLKNKLEQRQLHQQQTTKHSLQVTQQLLDLFEQLNQSGLLASITDDLEEPLKAIAQETKQFKKTSENYKQTIDQHDEQIKKLQQNYNELRNKLKQINLQQQ